MADDARFSPPSASNETVVNAARARDDGQAAVIATDAAGRILYWNEPAARLYGWTADEVLGRNVLDVTPTRRSGDAAAEIMEDMRTGTEWSGEFIVRDRHGSPMLVHVRNSVIRVADVVAGFVGISRRSTGTGKRRETNSASAE